MSATVKRNEDIRRSIEVLDNVLAEFDDCVESWESPSFPRKNLISPLKSSKYSEYVQCETSDQLETFKQPFPDESKVGESYSHAVNNSEQNLPNSPPPPPIPKRSPTTQLSEKPIFNSVFQFDQASLRSFDSSHIDAITDHNNATLSIPDFPQKQIRTLSPVRNDSDYGSKINELDKCTNCGRHLNKNQNTEMKGDTGLLKMAVSDKSPFSSRKSSSNSSNNYENVSPIDLKENISPCKSELLCEFQHSLNCTCEDRFRQLNVKFQRVLELIKQNKIKPLDKGPPSFVPPPPPVNNNVSPRDFSRNSRKPKIPISVSYPDFKDLTDKDVSFHDSLPYDIGLSKDSDSSSTNLCNKCSFSGQSPTVEDIPNLLPTDVLVRPQLGLSYSLEDDLSPGVKEIRQTSTPKSDVSPTSLFKGPESPGVLSTFSSNSATSLGYISSQSELDLNNLSEVPDKVPLSHIKSVTLPNGDRSPYYFSLEDPHDDLLRRYNPQRGIDLDRRLETRRPIRNYSAIDVGAAEKPKSRNLFSRFSRKDKKSVKK